jgi:DsbC/DsbD-like thiol-disulfide interchange protein
MPETDVTPILNTKMRNAASLGVATACGALLAAVSPVLAARDVDDEHPAEARLVSEFSEWAPGTTRFIGVHLKMDEGWHVYWDGQNETGLPVAATLDLPEGFSAGRMVWPVPRRYISPGDILDHVYEDEVTVLIPIHVPPEAKRGQRVTISGELEWLVCADVCIPGWGDGSVTVRIGSETEAPRGDGFEQIAASRANMPAPLPESQTELTLGWDGDTLEIRPRGPFEWAAFYPAAGSQPVERLIDTGKTSSGALRLPIRRTATAVGAQRPDIAIRQPVVTGIVEIVRGSDREPVRYQIRAPMPERPRGVGERAAPVDD